MVSEPTRRNVLLGGLAAVSLAAFPRAVDAQEPAAFRVPTDDASQELFDAYKVEQERGYTKITMDRVRPGIDESGTVDVAAIRLALNAEARSKGFPEPIIITDYAYDGPEGMYPKSDQLTAHQDELFEKAMPVYARSSQRPIVHIRVSAYGERDKDLSTLHAGALLNDLENNQLGPNGTKADVPGDITVPYLNVRMGDSILYDSAFGWYNNPAPEIQKIVGARILTVINQQNQTITAELDL